MRKLFLLTGYFFIAPVLLLCSIVFLSILSFQKNPIGNTFSFFRHPNVIAYAALPANQSFFNQNIGTSDARSEIIRQFFDRYGSPLEPFSQLIVDTADKYKLDYRLLPAIAMQESNLCLKAPRDSYNCWGFGIYDGGVKRFVGYEQAIEAVSKTLAQDYKNRGLESPQAIMSRYTPSSNGSWAFGVSTFMDRLKLTP